MIKLDLAKCIILATGVGLAIVYAILGLISCLIMGHIFTPVAFASGAGIVLGGLGSAIGLHQVTRNK